MPMVPLPFVFAAIALWAFWQIARGGGAGQGRVLVALALVALQMAVVGVRFGWGVVELVPVQQVLAALLPGAVWLAFRTGGAPWRHGIPAVGVCILLVFAPYAVDPVLALLALGYGAALVWLALAGETALAHLPIGQGRDDRRWLWVAAVVLVAMGATDMAALALAIAGQAEGAGALVGAVMVATLVAATVFMRQRRVVAPAATEPDLRPLFDRLEQMMTAGLFRDPDLTLGRIARRLSVPQRDISRAVNQCAGLNLSQYVNGHRVRAACGLLRQSDTPVAEIMFAVGFATKSNFHREFARVTGGTPGDWRRGG